jgi:hypothetical protein
MQDPNLAVLKPSAAPARAGLDQQKLQAVAGLSLLQHNNALLQQHQQQQQQQQQYMMSSPVAASSPLSVETALQLGVNGSAFTKYSTARPDEQSKVRWSLHAARRATLAASR